MRRVLDWFWGAVIAVLFVLALLLALRGSAEAQEPERLQLPPVVQAKCQSEGGCFVVSRARLAQVLQEAIEEAVAEALATRACKGGI